jgi:hypothetical protein
MEEGMRTILLAGVALALSACGSGGETTANDMNAMTADNMLMDENLMLDPNASINGTTLDANASVNATTQNLMEKDAVTNDPDTNLANGL